MTQPVTFQPSAIRPVDVMIPAPDAVAQQWMPRPVVSGCPPGLEYLTQVDQILIQQRIDIIEVFTDWQAANSYVLKNTMGQQVYFASEESEVCHRQLCGEYRGFVMHITDNLNKEVMRMRRQFKCCAGCCWCSNSDGCSFEISVEAPVGETIGYVRQRMSCCAPVYSITDARNSQVLHLGGPACICQGPCCTQDVDFPLYTNDDIQIGKISKQWAGCCQETFTTADNFSVSFPMDLDVRMKATLLGAVLLLDYVFFEYKPEDNE